MATTIGSMPLLGWAAWRAAPGDPDVEEVGRRHGGAGAELDLAVRAVGRVVEAVDLVAGKALEQPVGDHRAGAAQALLGRLEDEQGRAVEVAGLGEVARRAEQHGGVAVMAAGVHLARHRRAIGQVGLLLDRQGVHVGAQADAPARPVRPSSTPTTPVPPMPRCTVDAEARELLRRRCRRCGPPRSRARDGRGGRARIARVRRRRSRCGRSGSRIVLGLRSRVRGSSRSPPARPQASRMPGRLARPFRAGTASGCRGRRRPRHVLALARR